MADPWGNYFLTVARPTNNFVAFFAFAQYSGYFNFGFPEGEHSFIINSQDTINIEFLPHQNVTSDIIINNNTILGDVNNDSMINILDIVSMVNFILDVNQPDECSVYVSDFNDDGLINILDVLCKFFALL